MSDVKKAEEASNVVKYKPLFGRVLIKREVHEKIGSVLLPDNIQKRHAKCEGVVVDKGPTADESIQIGSRVIFGRHAGTWLDATYGLVRDPSGKAVGVSDQDDGTLFLCQDEDILAFIEK